jgi:hypothetical protein
MALLVAPVHSSASEPWLRAAAGSGLSFHLLQPAGGSQSELGRGLEDLLQAASVSGCLWVARLSGPGESMAYALDVLGIEQQRDPSVVVLDTVARAAVAVVDAVAAGAQLSVVLAQCASAEAGSVVAAFRGGAVEAGLRLARLALLRDAWQAWAVVGTRGAAGAFLARLGAAIPPVHLADVAAPPPARAGGAALRERLALHRRLPARLTAAVASLLIAAVAVGSAAWAVSHRSHGPPLGGTAQPFADPALLPVAPQPRAAPMSATWDRTGEVILFGGADAGSGGHGLPLDDTWRGALPPESAWQLVDATVHPSARMAGAIAADTIEGDVILYGGEGLGNSGLSDTWSYADGWRLLTPHTIPPPGPALAATDPSTGHVLMVTSCCALAPVPTGERMQTWRWSGADWVLLGAAPGWVSTAALVTDAWDGTVVMLADGGGGQAVTYVWDGQQWSRPAGIAEPPIIPGKRPQLTYDPRTRTVLDVVTAVDGAHRTWVWNGSTWRSVEAQGGPPVVGLVLSEPVDGRAVLYGGATETDQMTQRWFWTGGGWAEPAYPPAVAEAPTAGFGTAVAADRGSGGLVAMGGSQAEDETWVWTGTAWSRAFFTTPSPPPRLSASMAYDPVSRQALLVGGRLQNGDLAVDMWVWHGSEWSRVTGGLPPPTLDAPMAWDRSRQQAILLVADGSGPLAAGQTWTWTAARGWSLVATPTSPPARRGSTMTFDPATGMVLLLVPCCAGATEVRSQTWAWDGVTWHRLQTMHSPPLHAYVTADAAHGRTLLVAACCGRYDDDAVGPPDTWTWDGRDWTRMAVRLPALQDVAAVVDDANGTPLLVGRVAGAGPRHPLDGLWRWTGAAWERLL